jgi:putative Holliday junction resolvase
VIVLAFDVGTRTIGVASADSSVGLATPRFTLSRAGVKRDVVALVERAITAEVGALVVGLPIQDDGEEGRSARLARQVGEALAAATGLPLHYQDESYSTVEAQDRLRAAGHDSRAIRELVDQAAAAVILEDWLAENPQGAL